MPTPPLGAGAGAGIATPAATSPRHLPPSASDSALLPAADGAGVNPVNSTLFGGGPDNGKAVVPSTTRRVPYSLTLGLSGSYDSNPFLSGGRGRGDDGADFSFGLSATFLLGLDNLVSAEGNYLHFAYTPVATLYVEHGRTIRCSISSAWRRCITLAVLP